jgi:hypothetical protein
MSMGEPIGDEALTEYDTTTVARILGAVVIHLCGRSAQAWVCGAVEASDQLFDEACKLLPGTRSVRAIARRTSRRDCRRQPDRYEPSIGNVFQRVGTSPIRYGISASSSMW